MLYVSHVHILVMNRTCAVKGAWMTGAAEDMSAALTMPPAAAISWAITCQPAAVRRACQTCDVASSSVTRLLVQRATNLHLCESQPGQGGAS